MVKPRRKLLVVSAVLFAIISLLALSYWCASSQSDALVAKDTEPWERVRSRFVMVSSITGGWGPSWDFSYDCPKNYFGVGYLTIRMSLLGRPLGSNPRGALKELQSHP
jgi:hypothetical protein